MSIRDFGTSLLSNVRARKDAGQAEARDYERSQKNKDMRSAFFAPFLAEGIRGLVGSVGRSADTKTQNFLNSSEALNNQVLLNATTKKVDTAVLEKAEAKKQGVELTAYHLDNIVNEKLAEQKALDPGRFQGTADSFWIAGYKRLEQLQDEAASRAAYTNEVYKRADEFTAGRESLNTLKSLVTKQNRGLGRRFIERVTGNVTTVDTFNAEMENLIQLKLSKEIEALPATTRSLAQNIVEQTGDPVLGLKALKSYFTQEQIKTIQKNSEKGYKTTFTPTFKVLENGQLIRIDQQVVTDNKGSFVRESSTVVPIGGKDGKPPTEAEIGQTITQSQSVQRFVMSMTTPKGYDDYIRVALKKKFLKANMTMKDWAALNTWGMDPLNYTNQKEWYVPKSEAAQVGVAAYIAASRDLILELNSKTTSDLEKEELLKTYRTGLNLLSNISVSDTIDKDRREKPKEEVAALPDKKEPVVFKPKGVDKTKPFVLGQKAVDGNKKLIWNGFDWEEIL